MCRCKYCDEMALPAELHAKDFVGKFLVALVVLLTVGTMANCSAQDAGSNGKNVLLVVADDLRADVLSIYGGPVSVPNLERLAKRGVVFDGATCGYPICHVSRTELLTGRFLVSEAASGKSIPVQEDWSLWPQRMREAGWKTIHCGKWHMHGRPWERGYQSTEALYSSGGARGRPLSYPLSSTGRVSTGYRGWTFKTDANEARPELGVGLTPHTDRQIADGAIRAIKQSSSDERPFFVHVNFTAPHDPLLWPAGLESAWNVQQVSLPENFRPQHPFDHGNLQGRDEVIVPAPRTSGEVKQEWAVYLALVQNLDLQLGRILQVLDAQDALENTVLIFTSDQGLALGSHGLMGKQNQYDPTARVPLLMAGPGLPAGQRTSALCGLRDLYPTLCELFNLSIPASVQGESLVPLLRGETDQIHAAIYGYFTDTQRMVQNVDGWKLIWYPHLERFQLFHLPSDPNELVDLASESDYQETRSRMFADLQSWLKERGDSLVRH